MASNLQPTLAPAPHRLGPHLENAAEHSLAQHLGAHLHNGHPTVGHDMSSPNVGGPQDQNIDPAIAGPGMIMANAGDGGPDENGIDMKKGGKRELSTSKRAAQNRAAQRAFRQRKEGHIKELESQVKDYNNLLQRFSQIQNENYQLRDYIISLQSRLLEAQAEFPQPPPNIDLHRRSSGAQQQQFSMPTAPMGSPSAEQLRASAAQAVVMNEPKMVHETATYANEHQPLKKPMASDENDPKHTVGQRDRKGAI